MHDMTTSYQKWTEQLLNDHIKDKTLTVKLVSTPEQVKLMVRQSFAHNVIRLPQYIISVGQHLDVNIATR